MLEACVRLRQSHILQMKMLLPVGQWGEDQESAISFAGPTGEWLGLASHSNKRSPRFSHAIYRIPDLSSHLAVAFSLLELFLCALSVSTA